MLSCFSDENRRSTRGCRCCDEIFFPKRTKKTQTLSWVLAAEVHAWAVCEVDRTSFVACGGTRRRIDSRMWFTKFVNTHAAVAELQVLFSRDALFFFRVAS